MKNKGIENPNVIDLVTYSERDDEYVLIMIEDRNWELTDERKEQLKKKLDNYITFVVSGEIYKVYPEAKDKNIRIQLDYTQEFNDKFWDALFVTIRTQILQYNIKFELNKI